MASDNIFEATRDLAVHLGGPCEECGGVEPESGPCLACDGTGMRTPPHCIGLISGIVMGGIRELEKLRADGRYGTFNDVWDQLVAFCADESQKIVDADPYALEDWTPFGDAESPSEPTSIGAFSVDELRALGVLDDD